MKEIVPEGFYTSLILQLKSAIYGVIKNEDGTITLIDTNGRPHPNAGSIIGSQGGVEATLLKCYKSSETFGEIIAKQAAANDILRRRRAEARERITTDGKRLDIGDIKLSTVDGMYYRHKYPQGWQQISEERYLEIKGREEGRINSATTAYNNLLEASSGVIETTPGNLAIVMRYLNTQDLASWNLPRMSIGYSANKYDCDGKAAVTIKLDEPMPGDDETMFELGAPDGHLSEYRRVR